MAALSLREQMKLRNVRPSDAPFSVVFVCTGNICRSPLGEQLFRSKVAEAGMQEYIRFSSAGTNAMTGSGMPEQAAALSLGLGADPTKHAARDLTSEIIENADLVFALAREHRSAIVRLVPRASTRTFTLIEFSRVLQAVANEHEPITEPTPAQVPEFLRALIERVASRRGSTPPPEEPESDDVLDPYKRSQQSYDLSASQIVGAGRSIVSSLQQIARAKP